MVVRRLPDAGPFIVSAALAMLTAALPAKAQTALPAEAAQAREALAAETGKAKAQHEAARAALPTVYIGQLATLKRKFQEDGDLDGMLATMKEAKRFVAAQAAEADPFEAVPELTTEALVAAPAELRQLQDAYLKSHADRAEALTRQVEERVAQLIARLEALVKDLTRQNRIEEALAVRAENERWRQALAEKRAFEAADRLARDFPAAAQETPAETPAEQKPPDTAAVPAAPWRAWKLDRIATYAQEGSLFAHPDLPDELTLAFDEAAGEMRVQGVCTVAQAPVEMRERSWFGKAVRWSVPTPEHLQATFHIVSKELAPGKDFGPAVQLVVQNDKTRQQVFTLPLTYRETTLRIEYDKTTAGHRIVWVQGQTAMPVTLPPGAGAIRLLFTITVCRVGERCDSVIAIR